MQITSAESGRASPLPFSSPLFFSGFLVEFSGSNEEGMGVDPYIRGGTPVARGGATGPPAAPVGRAQWSTEGGRQAPLHFFLARDLVANLKKK